MSYALSCCKDSKNLLCETSNAHCRTVGVERPPLKLAWAHRSTHLDNGPSCTDNMPHLFQISFSIGVCVCVCVCVFAYNFMWSAWSGPSQPAICRKNLTLQLHVQHVCVMSSKFRITSRWRQVSDQLLLSWTALRWKRLMTQCTTMHDNHIGMNML